MKRVPFATFLLLTLTVHSYQLFNIRLAPSSLTSVPAVHSGAFGTYDNKWFFIGGRSNGLHGFQTPFAFPNSGINDSIYIVDPITDQRWSASVYSLPDSIREPITSSNMQFYLNDSILYMVGGYGWKDGVQNFVTWPTLTAVNMKGLMQAIIQVQPIESYFRRMDDSVLAICGAHLHKLDSTYYLVFGHRFDGYYDRTDTSGFHVQEYSHEVRKFQIADDGTNLSIYNYSAVRDTANFRRRDYNLLPFWDLFRGEGLLAFSGVFRKGSDLPYFTPIEIFKDTVIVRHDFNQNLSQYHSAVVALYDSSGLLQHNLFFGGMSMYYLDTLSQQTVTDSLIPFVRTISNVIRDFDFNYHEFDAGIQMPALLGTNAYFFPDLNVPMYRTHYIHLNQLARQQRIGYIVGGIESSDLNIADIDPGALSFANANVYEVYLDTIETSITAINGDVLNFICYPNPVVDKVEIEFELKKSEMVKLELLDMRGRVMKVISNSRFTSGKQKLLLDISGYPKGVYNCVMTLNNQRKSIRLVKD